MWSFCDEGKNILIFLGSIDNKLINFVGVMLAMLRLSVMSPLIYFKITGTFWSSKDILYLCLLTVLSYIYTITQRSFLSFLTWAVHI